MRQADNKVGVDVDVGVIHNYPQVIHRVINRGCTIYSFKCGIIETLKSDLHLEASFRRGLEKLKLIYGQQVCTYLKMPAYILGQSFVGEKKLPYLVCSVGIGIEGAVDKLYSLRPTL